MPSMRIDIEATSVRQVSTYLREGAQNALALAAATERIALPNLQPSLAQLERLPTALLDTAAGYQLIAEAQKGSTLGVTAGAVTRTERYAEAVFNVAAATELLARAQQGLKTDPGAALPTTPAIRTVALRPVNRQVGSAGTTTAPTAVDDSAKIPVGPAQRVAQLERALDEARTKNDAAQIADTRAALQRAVSQRETQARALQVNQPTSPGEPGARKPAVNGLYQRQEVLLSRQSEVSSFGSTAEKADFQRELAAVQERIAKYEEGQSPKGFGARLLEALGTSRFSLGSVGGVEISPLINRLGLLGGGEGAGGLAGGAAGAATGGAVLAGLVVAKTTVDLFTRSLGSATRELRDFRAAQTESGGTAREVASLSAAGVPAGQIAQLGDQLRERLSLSNGDPFALGAGARAGIAPQMGAEFGGNQDNAGLVVQAFDYLRNVKATQGAEMQLLEARRLGLAASLDLINVSAQVAQQQRQDAEIQAKLYTPEQTQQARDYAAQWDRLNGSIKLLQVTATSDAVGFLADTVGGFADAARDVAEEMNSTKKGWLGVEALRVPDFRKLREEKTAGANQPPLGQTEIAKQTAATKDLTRTMEGLKEGFLRGGGNADKALPAGLSREALRQALKLGAIRRKAVVL